MAQLILEKENGERIVLKAEVAETTTADDILLRSDYFATVLWSKEDIASTLVGKGFKDSDENINHVIDSGELEILGICSDADWYVIDKAIDELKHVLEKI